MKSASILRLVSIIPSPVLALVGISNHPYDPTCAYACSNALSSYALSCSMHGASTSGHSHGGSMMTSAECRAGDSAYLTTLAWCMSTKCAQYQIATSLLQKYWEDHSTTDPLTIPKWDYSIALQNITDAPTYVLTEDDVLTFTALASQDVWDSQYRTMTFLEDESAYESIYGVAILTTGFAIPILFTYMGCLPYMTGVLGRVKPYLVYPSIIRTYQVRPLPYLLGNAPTIGQSLYIALIFILNIVLTAVNYKSTQPAAHAWFPTQKAEILGLIFYRTGVFAFALAPLVVLFSGRNNILLWLSNWSHSTFILLHRWVARIFALHVILHSILAVLCYKESGMYAMEANMPYWMWGVVGTVTVSIMLVASSLYVRRKSYEVFLITHIVLAVFVIVGSWYHIDLRFPDEWGYKMWLYATCAVWFFDRLLRLLRILKTGIRRATVADIGDGIVRVDVEGVYWSNTPGQHLYAYFPTINKLRPWENHPFSLLPMRLLRSSNNSMSRHASDQVEGLEYNDAEKYGRSVVQTNAVLGERTPTGVTLFIKKSAGITNHLKAHHSLLTLLDGPYPNNSISSILRCERVLLIAGGIGITGLLPWATSHSNAKLCWSVKETTECLVRAMDGALSRIGEKDIRVGRRLDIKGLLNLEARSGWTRIGVVVCGPAGLCDDVRAAVVAAGRSEQANFELEVDAFSW